LTSRFVSVIFCYCLHYSRASCTWQAAPVGKNPGEPFMSRKIYLAISLILIGGLVAAWYFLAPSKQSSTENSNDVPDLGAETPISVKVQYARQGTNAGDGVMGRVGDWEKRRWGDWETRRAGEVVYFTPSPSLPLTHSSHPPE
jgi:hypothetical protein